MRPAISRKAYDKALLDIEELRKGCIMRPIRRMDDTMFMIIQKARENAKPVFWDKLLEYLKKQNMTDIKTSTSLRRFYSQEKKLREQETMASAI